MAITCVPSARPSSSAAFAVMEATSLTPPASSATFAVASPLVMPVTVALILFRALRRMAAPICRLQVRAPATFATGRNAQRRRCTTGRITPAARGHAHLPAAVPGGKLMCMASDHRQDHHEDEHDHGHEHGADGHVHDASCAVAHGTVPAPGEDKVLAAVFATPVASYLLRYGADAGYRAVLVEPDPERAKAVTADGFELSESLDGIGPGSTDVVVTDHH